MLLLIVSGVALVYFGVLLIKQVRGKQWKIARLSAVIMAASAIGIFAGISMIEGPAPEPVAESTPVPATDKEVEPVQIAADISDAPAAVTISKDEFLRIKSGMSYAEVAEIIGGEGELLSESGDPGEDLHTIMVMYQGNDAISGSNANFMFQGDKLINKSQIGLK